MHQTINAVPRLLRDRRALILIFAVITIAVVACRGSGSDPSVSDQELPVILPTVPASECINHIQPDGAPTFDQLDFSRLQEQEPGLRFYEIEAGTGETPTLADAVSFEYTGWLDDGCMVDTSYPNPDPINAPMLNILRGWQAAFTDMQEGSTRVIEVGPELGYGAVGFPPRIPANATLIFHITLINRVTIAEAQATVQAEIAEATAQAATATETAVSARETAVASGTVFPEPCVNHTQPEDAPSFDDIDFDRFEALNDGVRFYDIETGTGESPAISDTVSVEYTGWLQDGCIFDTSFDDEGPISFPLANVIQGWQDGLNSMQEGGVRVIEIAPERAYGERGSGDLIPPNATIIFHVELLAKQ